MSWGSQPICKYLLLFVYFQDKFWHFCGIIGNEFSGIEPSLVTLLLSVKVAVHQGDYSGWLAAEYLKNLKKHNLKLIE